MAEAPSAASRTIIIKTQTTKRNTIRENEERWVMSIQNSFTASPWSIVMKFQQSENRTDRDNGTTRTNSLEIDVDGAASNSDDAIEAVVGAADRLGRARVATNANSADRRAGGTNENSEVLDNNTEKAKQKADSTIVSVSESLAALHGAGVALVAGVGGWSAAARASNHRRGASGRRVRCQTALHALRISLRHRLPGNSGHGGRKECESSSSGELHCESGEMHEARAATTTG